MKPFISHLRDEEGSILVIGLIMLAFLTILGIAATRTSQIEIQVAGNDEYHKIAFYSSDSGIYTTPKLISAAIDNGTVQNVDSGSYTPNDGSFYREVLGFDAWDSATDIQFIMGDFDANVDVNRTGQQSLPGGGTEFASGAEGIGVGSAGGVAIFYDVDSFGTGPNSAQSRITAVYRKVVGVAGGL
ncbi:MAG: pilus assembly PilX N-terminal domain-containing protein [Deltaproteobacteria bacterium]|nr:MAG: pilus assembly PilX N-terminal domain-containing protein [Deltaproteobacteria bacterium]